MAGERELSELAEKASANSVAPGEASEEASNNTRANRGCLRGEVATRDALICAATRTQTGCGDIVYYRINVTELRGMSLGEWRESNSGFRRVCCGAFVVHALQALSHAQFSRSFAENRDWTASGNLV